MIQVKEQPWGVFESKYYFGDAAHGDGVGRAVRCCPLEAIAYTLHLAVKWVGKMNDGSNKQYGTRDSISPIKILDRWHPVEPQYRDDEDGWGIGG